MSAEQEDVKRLKVNASTRLYDALSKMAGQPTQQHTVKVIRVALGIDEINADSGYLKSYAVLYRMLEIAEREQAYYLHDEIDEFKPSLDFIRGILNPVNSGVLWEQRKPVSWETRLADIRHAGLRLKKMTPECELRKDELADILTSIDELRMLVESSSIPDVAKQKLRERCFQLQISVEEYRFWGVEGIELKFESLKGGLLPFVERDAHNNLTKDWPLVRKILVGITLTLGLANTTVKTVEETYHLLEPIIQLSEEHDGPIIEATQHKLPH